jgi:two-component system, NtrC family, sensor kinase
VLLQRREPLQTTEDSRSPHADLEAAHQRIRRLEQSLSEVQRLATVGQLASRMAHEFNNILMMIMGRAGNALKSDDPKAKDAALEKAIACSQRGADIVRGLVDYARGGRTESQRIAADDLLESAVNLIAWDLKKSGIELVRQYDTDQCVEVVPGAMEQVFLNLLLNARHAMNGHGGRLTVSVTADGFGGVCFAIQDTGCGIPPEHLDKIFDPFFTTRPRTAKDNTGGSGLGLAVARDLARQAGGDIVVESTPGAGSAFTVRLPAAE